MKLHIVKSGSSGNSYIVQDSAQNTLLIECGKNTFQETLKQVNIEKLSGGIFSHHHNDHAGDREVWEKFGIKFLGPENFTHAEQINIGKSQEWSIIPLAVEHDANIDTYAAFIKSNIDGKVFFFATDCFSYARAISALPEPLSICLCEINHSAHLLDTCRYPRELKQRISRTHCSLERATLAIARAKCTKFIAIHPSETTINQAEALEFLHNEFPNRSFAFATPGLTVDF